jgi:hypothetical protein
MLRDHAPFGLEYACHLFLRQPDGFFFQSNVYARAPIRSPINDYCTFGFSICSHLISPFFPPARHPESPAGNELVRAQTRAKLCIAFCNL